MLLAISPYHLTTREPAAMASLLLAEGVVTLLPSPLEGRDRAHVERAAASVPNFVRLMESWRWSMPLWREGVIAGAIEGREPVEDVRRAYRRIGEEESFAPLRALMKHELFGDEDAYLDAISRDVLRAGPDPGITVPLIAGLDAFAARMGLGVARSDPSSVVQRAEARLGERVLSVALPVLVQGSANRVLHARALLEESLAPLREAMATLINAPSHEHQRDAVEDVAFAAREYAVAFAEDRDELVRGDVGDDADESRGVEGTLALTGLVLPPDAALHASIAALRTMAPAGMPRNSGAGTDAGTSSVAHGLSEGRATFAILMKVLGRPADARRARG